MHGSEMNDVLGRCAGDHTSERVAIAHVGHMELGARMKPLAASSRKIVHDRDVVANRDEPLDEVTADKSGSAGHKDSPRHLRSLP